MVWIIVSWWGSPTLFPETVGVETDSMGRAKRFPTREEAERWARRNIQEGMWRAVEI